MSLLAGLSYDKKLAAIVVMSGWMLLSAEFKNLVKPDNKDTPIFMGHGTFDPLVRPALGKMSFDKLKEMGYNVNMKTYEYVATSTTSASHLGEYRFLTGVAWDILRTPKNLTTSKISCKNIFHPPGMSEIEWAPAS